MLRMGVVGVFGNEPKSQQFVGYLLKFELLQLIDELVVFVEPSGRLAASGPLGRLDLTQTFEQQEQRFRVDPRLFQSSELPLQKLIVELVALQIELGGVGKQCGVEAGESNREGLAQAGSGPRAI